MAEVFGVSVSGLCAFQKRQPSDRQQRDEELAEQLEEIHAQSRGTYGAPRIYEELKEQGVAIGKKRLARLMRQRGLKGRLSPEVAGDHEAHEETAPGARSRRAELHGDGAQQSVEQITYASTTAGFLYLAVVLDVFSRRVVGWSMANHLRTERVLDALYMAVQQRRPVDVIHHSDQDCQ